MKLPATVFRHFCGNGIFLVAGCGVVGLAGGLILAGILFSQSKPIYESSAIVALVRPEGVESGLSEYRWLETEAQEMVSQGTLTEAARIAMRGDNRGLPTAEYANQLQRAVHIRVEHRSRLSLTLPDRPHPDMNRELAESETVPRAVLVHVSMRGGDPVENARVVNAIVEVRAHHYARLFHELKSRKPDYASWLILTSQAVVQMPALKEELAGKRDALVAAMDAAGFHVHHLSNAALLNLRPPPAAKEAFASFCAASKKLTEAEKVAETPQPYEERFLEGCEVARPSTTPVGPLWLAFAWKWGLIGALAGLAVGIGLGVFSWARASPAQPGPRPSCA